ncbi:unnamed protein product, partial [Rhizophagus irregularis]
MAEFGSNIIAQTLSLNSVQNILEELGFEKDQIAKWNKPIDIPFGAATELFVAREAILAGLKFSRFDLYPELSVYIVDDGYIPGSVTKEAKSYAPEKIIGGPVHHRFSNQNILVYKIERLHKNNNNVHRTVTKPLEGKFKKKFLLFKGISKRSDIHKIFINGFGFGKNPENNEFGDGLYTTPNIDFAYKY